MGFLKANAVGLGTTDTTGRNAGVGTATGTLIFNTTVSGLQAFNGSVWSNVSSSVNATGGTKFTFGNNIVHAFTSTQPFVINGGPPSIPIEWVLIGGGGGGGAGFSNTSGQTGGGGGGGWFTSTATTIVAGTYTVTVGAGAPPAPNNDAGTNGGTSSVNFPTPISVNGGGGGGNSTEAGANARSTGNPGGSGGGGGSSSTTAPGAGTNFPGPTQQGFPGGSCSAGTNTASGGGGAGGAGENGLGPGNPRTANGGIGKQIPSTFRDPLNPFGASGPTPGGFFFSGGGGAGGILEAPAGSTGGFGPGSNPGTPLSGGGNGQQYPRIGTTGSGATNTGGGGGGSSSGDSNPVNGGAGGSGIVFIAYPSSI